MAACKHDVLRWDYHEEQTSCASCGLTAQTLVNELMAENDALREQLAAVDKAIREALEGAFR